MKLNLRISTRTSGMALMALAMGSLFLTSCSKKMPAHVKAIPESAGVVWSLNLDQLASKGELQRFKSTKAYESMKAESEMFEEGKIMDLVDKYGSSPSKTGIDFFEDFYFFAYGSEEHPFFGGVMKLESREKFESFLQEVPDGDKIPIEDKDGISFVKIDREAMIGWNDELIAFVGTDGRDGRKRLEEELLNVLSSKNESGSIADNDNFQDFNTGKHDAGMWVNTSGLMSMFDKSDVRRFLMSANELSEEQVNGNFVHMFLDFEPGAIRMTAESFYSDDLPKEYQGGYGRTPDGKVVAQIGESDPLLLASMGVNMDMLNEYLQGTMGPQLRFLEGGLGSVDLSVDKLMRMTTGDFAMSLNGFKDVQTTKRDYDWGTGEFTEKEVTENRPQFAIASMLNDKEVFDHIVGLLKGEDSGFTVANIDGVYHLEPRSEYNDNVLYLVEKDGVVTFSNDLEVAQNAAKGGGKVDLRGELADACGDNDFLMYGDCRGERWPDELFDERALRDAVQFNNATGVGRKIESVWMTASGKKAVLEIRMTDGDRNSFADMIEMLDNSI